MMIILFMKGKIKMIKKIGCWLIGIVVTEIIGAVTVSYISKKRAEEAKNSNPEYWKLKQVEVQEETKRKEAILEARQKESDKDREFEKNAPKEYWEWKKAKDISDNERWAREAEAESQSSAAFHKARAVSNSVESAARVLSGNGFSFKISD